jgi:malonyl-CoA reductase/3-hydroxypropionate dehydrogenase (NADP+)
MTGEVRTVGTGGSPAVEIAQHTPARPSYASEPPLEGAAAALPAARDSGRAGRLSGKVAFITGAAGNIGEEITRRYLAEGATVVMAGRSRGKLETSRERLLRAVGAPSDRAIVVTMDGADPEQVRAAIDEAVACCGHLHVVVNNAGSAGPKQPLDALPFSAAELEALRSGGSTDSERVSDAARSLFGIAWNVVRAAAPHLRPGASIVNVSTIFSRTQYYGRSAYVVPKAALNAFSRQLATELGARGVRVNTVFPGPIESERIRTVFAAMDRLRDAPEGSTAQEFFGMMTLARAKGDGPPERGYPTTADVANVIVFLGSEESAAINGHNFEVTHGMAVRQESRTTFVSRPGLRTIDGSGRAVLVAAGEQVPDALAIARVQADRGAEVLLGLPSAAARDGVVEVLGDDAADLRIHPVVFDRSHPGSLPGALAALPRSAGPLQGAVILPACGPARFAGAFADAQDRDVADFLDLELSGLMAIARALTRHWAEHPPHTAAPRVVFVTNGDDGAGNRYADVLRAATEELIRVWRDESEVQRRAGRRRWIEWSNQIIRWTNQEPEALPFAAGQAARILFTRRRVRQVNLYLPDSVVEATGAKRGTFGWMESLMGLHLGKVALITGGSAGIGGQIGRLLAIGGARVLLAARRADQLQTMRAQILEELDLIGYYGAEERVQIIAGVDVGDESTLDACVQAALDRFGRIDYLINNAGGAGAEEMVVDMPLDAWRYTLDANLISNYSLIQRVVPLMKARGGGYILNVSSYFGGEKYVAVPYPNRADYAVSKAGQRALVENLARFVGPEIQINAIAPGPVDGDRLRGTDGRPGLFERRGRLILENRRLNGLYAAVIESTRPGKVRPGDLLTAMETNDVAALLAAPDTPPPLRAFAERVAAEGGAADGAASCAHCLMNASVATKLVARLRHGGHFLAGPGNGDCFDDAWVAALPVPDEPFFPPAHVVAEAEKISSGVLSMLHLKHMPTEMEVALATVYFLADRAVSGETFQPSGGLQQERSNTERELFGSPRAQRLERMRGETVWLLGEHLVPFLARAARAYVEQCHVRRIVLLTKTAEAAAAIVRELASVQGADVVRTLVVGGDVEVAMDRALAQEGRPAAVISTPFAPMGRALFGGRDGELLDTAAFRELVEGNVTHHFRVARKASLMDGVRLVLVSPDVWVRPSQEEFALANFVKATLHAFTATLGVENERLVHGVPVNQINLTRRVRSEEPRDAAEQAEEIERFARAVLLASAPLPDAEDSRYRSRIYRGMAITV